MLLLLQVVLHMVGRFLNTLLLVLSLVVKLEWSLSSLFEKQTNEYSLCLYVNVVGKFARSKRV
jgi:hypothetical protein